MTVLWLSNKLFSPSDTQLVYQAGFMDGRQTQGSNLQQFSGDVLPHDGTQIMFSILLQMGRETPAIVAMMEGDW